MLRQSVGIDPCNITNYNRTDEELQWFWVFSLFVAGKNSDTAVKSCQKLHDYLELEPLLHGGGQVPFYDWYCLSVDDRLAALRHSKIGQYGRLQSAMGWSTLQITEDPDFLKTCTLEKLLECPGCGNKTARFFLLHSRPDCECLPLDRHILNWMREYFHIPGVPKDTPTNNTRYTEWEHAGRKLIQLSYPWYTLAEADLHIWRLMSGRDS